MAVVIQFENVIVRKSAAEQKYPGGLAGIARLDLANYLEDEHLVRIGFMSTREADDFANELATAGLRYSYDNDSDIAVIPWANEATPPWLSVGECGGREACWLRGDSPGKLIDFDPSMIFRWPTRVYPSVEDVVRVLRKCECDVDVQECGQSAEAPATIVLKCARKVAQIEVEVFKDSDNGCSIGVWCRRTLARMTFIDVDQALMRDLNAALVSAGAADPWSGP